MRSRSRFSMSTPARITRRSGTGGSIPFRTTVSKQRPIDNRGKTTLMSGWRALRPATCWRKVTMMLASDECVSTDDKRRPDHREGPQPVRMLPASGLTRRGNILFQYNLISGCSYHRVLLPLGNMPDFDTRVPVLYFNRDGFEPAALEDFRRRGGRVVIDLDDDIVLGDDHVLYDAFKDLGCAARIVTCVKLADAVLVTNEQLASRVAQFNRNVVVVPNALPFDEGQFGLTAPDGGRKIIYAGGYTHEADLRLVRDALPRDEFVLAGDPGTRGDDVASQAWTRIRAMLDFAEVRPALGVKEYMRHYVGRSISIAPLVDTPFNRCKSNLKALEAGAKGLAFVASRVLPYDNAVDKDVVLYASSEAEWKAVLGKLVDDPVYCAERGQALAEHVRRHYHIRDANAIRRQVFESFR
ncbi:glycosyltransferase family protein [Burkholderia dolosa]|uniref:glycosyltransferase n=1 Tax=Burkholderia dolosa TaxID=152500 RepID=UPI001C947083|nr:glycosyltransferase [Burkholderia dolosa]MBY4833976.1 glycosyltransferase [Burkholderia dolosa]